ncbi:PucR family transcriptional regulator [Actinomadura parmotrematis]|uniref:Helix-turn-helix domain-containing protein n=1 Tax=Actinomadura parmotrematis TaxID=2864039 RepID=A0ABS7FRF9_9ACTN|nr:helix-turn-helix domain-containing protein [Actinomadura parmotrematis]MBW8482127.1 helix-turn-helix domain-containing protein [Actinomadura parmotrematis]
MPHSGSSTMRRAVARMSGRMPELADRLAAQILAGEEYRRPAELRDDLWQVCRIGLTHGVESILEPGRGRTDLEWAARLGRRRAEQGQPLDRLLRGYRLAGCVFWEAVVDAVAQDEPESVPALVRHATRTWHTIDEQSTAASAAYHRTVYDLLRRSEERSQAVLDALLEGNGTDATLLAAAAEVLDLPEHGRYAVVVASGPEPPIREAWPVDGLRLLWRVRADTQVALAVLGGADLDDLVAALRPHVRVPAGVSPVVESLADLAGARRLADLARRAAGEGVVLLDRKLPDALVLSQPRLAARLGQVALGPVLEVEDGYRDVLLDTLGTWLDCDGSTARAAALLYCHPNTVLNRLRRVERLTGRDLAKPRDMIELALALSATRLLP